MIRVVLADDHGLVRHGLRAVLAAAGDCEVVGETGDGLAVVDLVERHAPDVLVLDVVLPGLNGLELCRRVTRRSPATRVVMLSMHANEAYVGEALQAGAVAYVLKDAAVTDLVRAIEAAVAGRRYLSPHFAAREQALLDAPPGGEDPYETLTDREREVLQLAAEGNSNQEIGRRLLISPRTVEIHRANMLRKLGLGSGDLLRYALRRGLVVLEG